MEIQADALRCALRAGRIASRGPVQAGALVAADGRIGVAGGMRLRLAPPQGGG